MYMYFVSIMNTSSSEQLCYPIGREKIFLHPKGQENIKLDNFQNTLFELQIFFLFKYKKNLNGKVLDLPLFSVFLFFVNS